VTQSYSHRPSTPSRKAIFPARQVYSFSPPAHGTRSPCMGTDVERVPYGRLRQTDSRFRNLPYMNERVNSTTFQTRSRPDRAQSHSFQKYSSRTIDSFRSTNTAAAQQGDRYNALPEKPDLRMKGARSDILHPITEQLENRQSRCAQRPSHIGTQSIYSQLPASHHHMQGLRLYQPKDRFPPPIPVLDGTPQY